MPFYYAIRKHCLYAIRHKSEFGNESLYFWVFKGNAVDATADKTNLTAHYQVYGNPVIIMQITLDDGPGPMLIGIIK